MPLLPGARVVLAATGDATALTTADRVPGIAEDVLARGAPGNLTVADDPSP